MSRAEERAARLASLAPPPEPIPGDGEQTEEPEPKGAKLSSSKGPRLSPRHQAVVDAWFTNGCVSKKRAMLAVGYTANAAGNVSSYLVFGRDDVKAAIQFRQKHLASRSVRATEKNIIAEMEKLAFANQGELLEVNEDGSAYLDLSQMNDDHRAALSEYSVETYEEKRLEDTGNEDGTYDVVKVPVRKSRIKFASKQAALDSLARILGMFKDKTEVTLGVASFADRIAKARERIHAAAPKAPVE